MNRYATIIAVAVCMLVVSFRAFSDEGLTAAANRDMPKNVPLLLQFNQAADLIVVGRATGLPRTAGDYSVATIEIERIVAAVWDEGDVNQHLDTDSLSKRIMVLQRLPFCEQSAAFLPSGRYLCWLNLRELSEAEQTSFGRNSSACYEVVKGMNDYSIVVPGVVLLSRHRELLGEREYERSRGILGKDPDWFEDRNVKVNFGIADRQEVTEAAFRVAGLTARGRDNDEELRLLAQSQERSYSRIASCLLGLGQKAQRFRYVDILQR